MKTPRFVPTGLVPLVLAILVSLALPGRLRSQDEHKGKIDDVEQSARNATKGREGHHDHDDGDGGGGFLFHLVRGLFHVMAHTQTVPSDSAAPPPEPPSQGYLAYPYARPRDVSTFVLRDVTTGREFASVGAAYFRDDGSTLRAGQFTFDAAYAWALLSAEYSFYREPMPDGTDYLHLGRVAVDGLGPLGDIGYFKAGLAVQAVVTDNLHGAAGPELDLGVQLFPGRPLGVAADARFAAQTWQGGPAFGTGFVDLMGRGSVFIGRVELQAGYRWTRVGVGTPFHGPTLGMRVWF